MSILLPERSHPAIADFELDVFLRHLAEKHRDDEYIPSLVRNVLVGGDHQTGEYDPTGLHAINDRLQELDDPTYDYYDLHKAAGDLHLDNAMNHIINAASYQQDVNNDPIISHDPLIRGRRHLFLPEIGREGAIQTIRRHVKGLPFENYQYVNDSRSAVEEGIKILRDQGHSDEDLLKSLNRHALRIGVARAKGNNPLPESPVYLNNAIKPPTINSSRYKVEGLDREFINKLPIKYQSSPAVSSFIQALRQLRSRNQEVRRVVPAAQYKKMGINVEHILDTVADSPHTASANTTHVISHDGDLDKVRTAIALVAQELNASSYLAMHEHDGGPDRLYQYDIRGGANHYRPLLDKAGITDRQFIEKDDKSGWWIMVYDKGNKMKQIIDAFSNTNKLRPNVSVGTGEFIGQGQQAEATKEDRKETLKGIRSYEQTGQYSMNRYKKEKLVDKRLSRLISLIKNKNAPIKTPESIETQKDQLRKRAEQERSKAEYNVHMKKTDASKYPQSAFAAKTHPAAMMKTFYKSVEKTLAGRPVKYSLENYHTILNTMTHNDFAGNKWADHTKRVVLADALQEAGHYPEAEQDAALLRSGQPVIMRDGRPRPAVERSIRVTSHHTASPEFVNHAARLSTQELVDTLARSPVGLEHPQYAGRTVHQLHDAGYHDGTYNHGPLHPEPVPDSNHSGYSVTRPYASVPGAWVASRSILLPIDHAHHTHYDVATGESHQL